MATKQYDNYADLITFTRASTGTYLDSDGLLKTATTNTPRIEYDINGNRKGLLIEEARTNTMTRSEEFDSWTQSNVITSSNVTNAPSGELTADKVAKSVTTAIGAAVVRAATTPTGSLVASFYAKAAEYDTLTFTLFNSTDTHLARASVSLVDGSLILNQNGTVTTEFVGNGWWRIIGIGTTTQTVNTLYIYPNDSLAYQGDGTSGIYVWGAQLEAGSFPTSYISTSGSTATRAADVASIPTSAFGYNADKGTVVVEHQSVASVNQRSASINDGTSNNAIQIVVSTSGGGSLVGEIRTNATGQMFQPSPIGITAGQNYKIAVAYAENDAAVSRDGTTPGTDSSVVVPSVSNLVIGAGTSSFAFLNGHIKSIRYWPRRLTNAQIQELTS